MKRIFFIFGRTPQLAFEELRSLYPSSLRVATEYASLDASEVPDTVMDRLGGTVKIVAEQTVVRELTAEVVFSALTPFVREGAIAFGISVYNGSQVSSSLYRQVKELFTARSIHARYAQSQHQQPLSSVVVEKQHIVELCCLATSEGFVLGVTRSVQDFESWNIRDSARPASDPKRGMLPPKVARMITNIALGPDPSGRVLVDPFCGVGTILSEALLSNATVVGFDISDAAVQKAKKNIAWLRAQYGLLSSEETPISVCDATHISEVVPPNSVDAIVTEPFMGEQVRVQEGEKVPAAVVKNIITGLNKLYIGCFREWTRVLKPNGKIVIALPAFVTTRGIVPVKNVVDRCESLGYTLYTGPIEYGRPQAVVRREFYVFQKRS